MNRGRLIDVFGFGNGVCRTRTGWMPRPPPEIQFSKPAEHSEDLPEAAPVDLVNELLEQRHDPTHDERLLGPSGYTRQRPDALTCDLRGRGATRDLERQRRQYEAEAEEIGG